MAIGPIATGPPSRFDKSNEVRLQRAREEDAQLLFDWANSPSSLSGKLETAAPLAWDRHIDWLSERLADPKTALSIVELAGNPIGQLRVQWKDGPVMAGYHVDIFLEPGHRGDGLAAAALRIWMKSDDRRPLVALVRTTNEASLRLFESLNFSLGGDDHGIRAYSRRD